MDREANYVPRLILKELRDKFKTWQAPADYESMDRTRWIMIGVMLLLLLLEWKPEILRWIGMVYEPTHHTSAAATVR